MSSLQRTVARRRIAPARKDLREAHANALESLSLSDDTLSAVLANEERVRARLERLTANRLTITEARVQAAALSSDYAWSVQFASYVREDSDA